MDNHQHEHGGENRRVVGPYIPPKRKKRRSYRGLLVFLCVLAVFAILGSAGAIYWKVFVKPPEAAAPEDDGTADTPVVIENNLPANLDAEDLTEEELEQLQAMIAEQAQEIDLTGVAQRDGVFTVLVVGTDVSGQLTDTIVVATFDTNQKSVAILNIPRDTISRAANGETHKINSAYGRGGMDRLITEVKNLVGYEVNRYVIVNFSAFTRIVDAIGGIEVDVPEDMYKNTGDMLIDLKAGRQLLDGEHALMLMRYRGYANADIDRIGVQQQVYKAVIEQLATPATILKLPSLTSIIAQNVQTDMTVGELIWIGTNYVTMNTDDVVTNTIPHTASYINNISYVLPSESEILELVNEYYNPYTEKITRLNLAEVPVEEVSVSTQQSAVTDAEDDSTEPDEAEDTETQVPGWISGSGSDSDEDDSASNG
ncbi:MAG: LCP family protein [Clostridiaceae bacterium]|nr:LCP family protein [Clostridiaceae bacterium]